MRPQNRKINSKGRPVRTKIQVHLLKQKALDLEQFKIPAADAVCEGSFKLEIFAHIAACKASAHLTK